MRSPGGAAHLFHDEPQQEEARHLEIGIRQLAVRVGVRPDIVADVVRPFHAKDGGNTCPGVSDDDSSDAVTRGIFNANESRRSRDELYALCWG